MTKPHIQLIANDYDAPWKFWMCSSDVSVAGYYGASGRTAKEAYEEWRNMVKTNTPQERDLRFTGEPRFK